MRHEHEWERVEDTGGQVGIALWRCSICHRGTVTEYDQQGGQVYSAMPGDMPVGSGKWAGRITDAGISYVAHGYSWAYARRVYRQQAAEWADCNQ